MKTLKEQVKELTENQKHILEAIKYLNERLETNLEKVNDEQIKDVNNMIESQTMIDQLLVKNSDDIVAIRKRKDDNLHAIKTLESKIEVMEKEIGETIRNIETKLDQTRKEDEVPENGIDDKPKNGGADIACRYFNRGFCKMKRCCSFQHKSDEICEVHLQGIKCENKSCERRHPKSCRYFKKGKCWRNETCVYLHNIQEIRKEQTVHNVCEEIISDGFDDVEENKECTICKTVEKTKECDKCGKDFCFNCELKVHGESVLELFKSYNFTNYTCNTTHILHQNKIFGNNSGTNNDVNYAMET